MVRVLSDIPPKIYEKIIQLIKAGEYDDIAQFITAACENQLTLAEEPPSSNPLVGALHGNPGSRLQPTATGTKSAGAAAPRTRKPRETHARERSSPGAVEPLSGAELLQALTLFRLPGDTSIPPSVQPMHEYTSVWPWGQANRYLPIKMVVRALANLADADGWPLIDRAIGSLPGPSRILGTALAIADAEAGRKRGTLLSTALPKSDSEKESSSHRFLGSFLCGVSPTGIFYPGGVFYYGLAGRIGSDRIGLTESGIAFCSLPNPVLDGGPKTATSTLSQEEILWLREYASKLQGEGQAFRSVLEALGDDELSPGDLAARVARLTGDDPKSGSFSIKLNGLVSRLIELGLIKREWKGTRARYGRNV